MVGREQEQGVAQVSAGSGHRLCAEQLDGVVPLRGGRLPGDRQQPEREDSACDRSGEEQLGSAGQRNGRRDGSGAVHDGGDVQAPGDRPVRLSERSIAGAVRAGEQADRGAVAPLAPGRVAAQEYASTGRAGGGVNGQGSVDSSACSALLSGLTPFAVCSTVGGSLRRESFNLPFLARDRIRRARTEKTPPQWYVNGQGQTMVVVPKPGEFWMGEGAERHKRRINRTFAIA